MKFQYFADPSSIDSRGRMIERPVLILELKTKDGEWIDVPALVDSGADKTIVNLAYAKLLGVELGDILDTAGIGKGILSGREGHFPFKIKDMELSMNVPAVYLDSKNVLALLGREAFFDAFTIVFDQRHGVFELIQGKPTAESDTMDEYE